MTVLPSRPFVLSAVVLLCLAVPPAASQVRVVPPERMKAQPVVARAAQAPASHHARIDGLRDSGPAALDRPLPGGWALAGFDLRFGNGDHKLRRIGVLGEERFVRFALADGNGDDPFNASARLSALPGVRVQQVSADGGGKFEIRLPGRAPADSTLVLSGFQFQRADGTDANLRNIGVWLDPQRNRVRVSLMDDQGLDFRGLEASLGAMAASAAIPLPGLLETGSVVAGTGAAVKGIGRMSGKYRGYRVTVQYAWIPNATVAQKGALAGTQARRGGAPSSRIDALQGFEFTFNNSDHHLLGLGVNGRGNGEAFFQDNNTDDPMQWSATYLTLRGPR
ncbi:hypothetical protein B1992_05500 [Pseudoxanthomonas broegbernensis]|uniref:Uncharacterized protein n=1 Tax=Pseudoxanthomonas broegbernensis TaxID=83619 RepID=A0A7V8GN76_9GAMM|nr:hypothetical protein [Pseudoxanthomonas broegbernensis]KAF1686849.1 hypothetical protein B1992_05500 [Pseudoxanthomonas broegbernensis]MBB6065563.1 hypothetical protein [Pseudoxanthomonas broegbernensis]